jgi:hypothetical protein
MRPTSAELIERIAEALDTTVLPAVADDKWASSVVRSATTLLAHLAKRVEREAPILLADNEDARTTIETVAADQTLLSSYPALHRSVLEVLEPTAEVPAFDAVALDARNREYQAVVEQLLRRLHDAAKPDSAEAQIRLSLRAYLKRRMEREKELYFPAFVGPPF